MRARIILSLLTGVALCSAASANSWHTPQIYEETNGDYSNYKYDDGLCQYYYNYNFYDKHAQVNRYGDCDHLVIGPDGHGMPTEDETPPE